MCRFRCLLLFNLSNSNNVELNGFGFNATLLFSYAKAYPSKEYKYIKEKKTNSI